MPVKGKVIWLTKVQLDFSDEWLAMARKTWAVVNMARLQQKLPRISFENWLKTALALSLSQTFAEVEGMTEPLERIEKKSDKPKPE